MAAPLRDMSVDQIVYFQMIKRGALNNQFNILLSLASFDCSYTLGITLDAIRQLLNIKSADHFDVCYKCKPNDKKLFDPQNIYADLSNTNCERDIRNLEEPDA